MHIDIVLETTFDVPLEPGEAMERARRFLGERGYATLPATAFQLYDRVDLTMRRGAADAIRATSMIDVPQEVDLQFGQGIVEATLSATPKPIGTEGTFKLSGINSAGDLGSSAREKKQVASMLSAHADALRLLLVEGRADAAATVWDDYDTRVRHAAERRRRRRRQVRSAVLYTLLAAVVGPVLYLAFRLSNPTPEPPNIGPRARRAISPTTSRSQ